MVFADISNFKLKISNSTRGITLVEVIVVILIISIFSMILISDFPKIKRQFALSRSVYKLAQDLRRAQDMALSGLQITDENGQAVPAKGYGIYINPSSDNKGYILYADSNQPADFEFTPVSGAEAGDYIVEKINLSDESPDVFIKEIRNIDGGWASINFSPPNPNITIANLLGDKSGIEIVFGLESDSSAERIISVNKRGLIEVK